MLLESQHLPLRWVATVALLAASVTVSGCSTPTGPEPSAREIGILQLLPALGASEGSTQPDSTVTWDVPPGGDVYTAPTTIQVPDSVAVGEAFAIVVYSIGINGCWGPDGQDDEIANSTIEITPYDRHSGAEACTEILGYLPHEGTFVADQPGEWTIRVRGRRVRGSDLDGATPVVAERT